MEIIAWAFGQPRWAEKWPTLTLQTSALPLGYGARKPQNLAQLDPGVIAAVDDVDDLVAHRQVEPDMRMGSKESIQARIVAGPSPQSSCRSRYGSRVVMVPILALVEEKLIRKHKIGP
jgi:hypothetical protein